MRQLFLKQGEKGYSEKIREPADVAPPSPAPTATDSVAGGYVASVNSPACHRPDCKSAAKISEKNLVRYNTRNEAIAAGKKPCRECNP
jgi:hypothetical protein